MLKFSILIGIIFAFIIGIVSIGKYYSHIIGSELVILTITRIFCTFILFFLLSVAIIVIINRQIPQLAEFINKGRKIDFTLSTVLPNQIKIEKAAEEIKKAQQVQPVTISNEITKKSQDKLEKLRKFPPELLAQVIRSAMSKE